MLEYDVIVKGVSFGDDAVGEFVRFSLDDPLSRGFFPSSIIIFKARHMCTYCQNALQAAC